jgi:hypothetical protein
LATSLSAQIATARRKKARQNRRQYLGSWFQPLTPSSAMPRKKRALHKAGMPSPGILCGGRTVRFQRSEIWGWEERDDVA